MTCSILKDVLTSLYLTLLFQYILDGFYAFIIIGTLGCEARQKSHVSRIKTYTPFDILFLLAVYLCLMTYNYLTVTTNITTTQLSSTYIIGKSRWQLDIHAYKFGAHFVVVFYVFLLFLSWWTVSRLAIVAFWLLCFGQLKNTFDQKTLI